MFGGYTNNETNIKLFKEIQKDMVKMLHGTKPDKPLLTYEYVILKNMNFNLRPPFRMIR